MDIPNAERIDGILHSQWLGPEPPPCRVAGMGCATLLFVCVAGSAVIVGLVAIGMWHVRHDRMDLGMSFVKAAGWLLGLVFATTCGGITWMAICQALQEKALSQGASPLPPRPEGVPSAAVPITVWARGGKSQGWLWTDGPWAVFQGDQFEFRINSSNLVNPRQMKTLLNEQTPILLRLAEKQSLTLQFEHRYEVEGRSYRSTTLASKMRPQLSECLTYPTPVSEALYPPRHRRTSGTSSYTMSRLQIVLLSIATGGVALLAGYCAPVGPSVGSAIGLFLYGALAPAAIMLLACIKPKAVKRGSNDDLLES